MFPDACNTLHPSHLPVLITLITCKGSTNHDTSYCAISCNLLLFPPAYEHLPQHYILEHPQPTLLDQCQRSRFAPIQSNRQNSISYIFVFVSSYSILWDLPHWKLAHPKETCPTLRFNSYTCCEVLQNHLSKTTVLMLRNGIFALVKACSNIPWGDKTKKV